MKTINLKAILLQEIPDDCYWEDMGNLTNCPEHYVIIAMKEAVRHALELAAENAKIKSVQISESEIECSVNIKSITNTINQVV
jgi:hypothetical protein